MLASTPVRVAIVVAALYFGRPVLLPLAVGVLFAFALAPLVSQLRRFGAGRILSVLIAAVLAIGFTGAIGMYITTTTLQVAGELPRYQTNLIEKITASAQPMNYDSSSQIFPDVLLCTGMRFPI